MTACGTQHLPGGGTGNVVQFFFSLSRVHVRVSFVIWARCTEDHNGLRAYVCMFVCACACVCAREGKRDWVRDRMRVSVFVLYDSEGEETTASRERAYITEPKRERPKN